MLRGIMLSHEDRKVLRYFFALLLVCTAGIILVLRYADQIDNFRFGL